MRLRLRPLALILPVFLTGTAQPPSAVKVAFRNVHLRVATGVVLEVRHLEGSLLGTRRGSPPTFDDPQSFTVHVDSGQVAISAGSLTHLLNDYVLAFEDSPLSDVHVEIDGNRLKQTGTLRKGAPIPFSVSADLSATPDGRIRLHAADVKAAGIPAEGLMKVFGLELDDLVKSNRAHGLQIADNDILLDPALVLPPPRLAGRLTDIRIEGDRIVERFGTGARTRLGLDADRRARNYMYYRGNTLRFGKLTMIDTDMQLIDADPGDPFDFSPPEYVKHLVAGYSKNTPSGGLRVFMPDYGDLAGADLRPTRVLH